MTDNELDGLRNSILATLIAVRDEVNQSIWLDKRVFADKLRYSGPMTDVIEAVGSLNQLDYVEIDKDLKPEEILEDFANIRLTNAGQAFYDHGNRFVVAMSERDGLTAPLDAIVTEKGDFVTAEGGEYLAIEQAAVDGRELLADSELWTGRVGKVLAETARREEFILLLDHAEKNLTLVSASNSERALARAYIIAAKTLAEAPEPPEDMIWELIFRASALAGVASLFVAIIALLSSVGQ